MTIQKRQANENEGMYRKRLQNIIKNKKIKTNNLHTQTYTESLIEVIF